MASNVDVLCRIGALPIDEKLALLNWLLINNAQTRTLSHCERYLRRCRHASCRDVPRVGEEGERFFVAMPCCGVYYCYIHVEEHRRVLCCVCDVKELACDRCVWNKCDECAVTWCNAHSSLEAGCTCTPSDE